MAHWYGDSELCCPICTENANVVNSHWLLHLTNAYKYIIYYLIGFNPTKKAIKSPAKIIKNKQKKTVLLYIQSDLCLIQVSFAGLKKCADVHTWIPDPSGTVIFHTQLRLLR